MRTSPRRVPLRSITLIAAAALGLAAMPGCLVSGSSSDMTTGTFVGEETFSQIEPGKTGQDWVLATMGKPTSKSTLDDGTEMWKWSYHRYKRSSGGVLFLVGSSSRSETRANSFVQFSDGVVIKAWQD